MEIFNYTFFQHALIGITIIAIATAIIGTYITTRRMVFISGGITHACFGGLGLGYWLGFNPILGAAIFAVAGALGIDFMDRRGLRNDSAVAVIWALGMALGTLFVFLTAGYVPELNSFLFGNVLTITRSDLWIFAGFTSVLLAFYAIMYPSIVAVSFDADFARTRRLPVTFINIAMSVFTALAIVMTIRMVGIMLLMSMVTLPQMTAEIFTSRYGKMLFASAIISILTCISGLMIASIISVPASATIVLCGVIIFFSALLYNNIKLKFYYFS